MKRPAFQFYPADWRKDAALQLCSIQARGLWIDMLCLMHEAEPYGHLVAAGAGIEPAGLARLVGESPKDVQRWLAELEAKDVYSKTADGVIFSRRMVRDQKEREEWAERQHKSRDNKRDKPRDNGRDIERDNDGGVTSKSRLSSPSSSSSPSIQDQEPGAPTRKNGHAKNLGTRLEAGWSLPDDWRGWAIAYRPDLKPEQIDREALVFRDYWHAKAGADARKADWPATWRNWIRRKD